MQFSEKFLIKFSIWFEGIQCQDTVNTVYVYIVYEDSLDSMKIPRKYWSLDIQSLWRFLRYMRRDSKILIEFSSIEE